MPSTLLRKLNNYSHKNKLYLAFKELGNVIRTIFLLEYISNIEMRQQITSSTNKAESYNGFLNIYPLVVKELSLKMILMNKKRGLNIIIL